MNDKPKRPTARARTGLTIQEVRKAQAAVQASEKAPAREAPRPVARARRGAEPPARPEPVVQPLVEDELSPLVEPEAYVPLQAEDLELDQGPAPDELAPLVRAAQEAAPPQTVIITGICGRMGRLVARHLHRRGPVIGIDRRKFDGKPEDVVHYQMDLRRRKTRDIFRAGGIRAVVHLGIMHDPRESDRTHHEWNVLGFQKLLDYMSLYRVKKLVVLSTATLYGPRPDNAQFLSEEAPLLGAQDFSQIRDLVEVDMLAQSFFWKDPEIETVILRPCHILGRVRNAPSNYCRMERPPTVMGFDPMMQVIHERDVVEAIALALKPGVRGIFNLRGPGELPLSRMLRVLGRRPLSLPGPMMRALMSSAWSSRTGGFPAPEIDHLRYVCMVDDTRARRELGFRPRYDLEQTLRAVFSER
jgi:UDP-glucose 4-epimerase